MDAISTAMAAWEGIKATKEILGTALKATADFKAKEEILTAQEKIGDVQDRLFELRDQLNQLQNEKRDLADKLREAEAWAEKVGQFELAKASGGAIAYKFKGEPVHYACPSCLNSKQIQPLQFNNAWSGVFTCQGCKANYQLEPTRPMPTRAARL